jgi:hypothetical protein
VLRPRGFERQFQFADELFNAFGGSGALRLFGGQLVGRGADLDDRDRDLSNRRFLLEGSSIDPGLRERCRRRRARYTRIIRPWMERVRAKGDVCAI